MIRIVNQTPRYCLLQRFQRVGQRVLLWFAEPEVDMFRHDYIPTQAKTGLEWATRPRS